MTKNISIILFSVLFLLFLGCGSDNSKNIENKNIIDDLSTISQKTDSLDEKNDHNKTADSHPTITQSQNIELEKNSSISKNDTAKPNQAPIAISQNIVIDENSSKTIILSASDSDGDKLKYIIITPPAHGTFINSIYKPNSGYIGSDSFTFKANDGINDSNIATINITINKIKQNHPPIAQSQNIELDKNSSIDITLLATDDDNETLIYKIISNPSFGTLSGNPPNLTYIPNINYHGRDSFTFKADDGTNDSNIATINITINDIVMPISYECPANLESEDRFNDIFITNSQEDRSWSIDITKPVTVDQIASEFNSARANDPTINSKLIMPSQAVWDSFSNSQKALYLINSERCARGIRIFEGIDTNIVTAPAQQYADYLKNNNAWGHEEDGRDPWQRLEEDAGVEVGINADFFKYAENLAYISYGYSLNYPTLHEVVAMAVYGWLYDDKKDTLGGYGHRKFILATGLKDNFGKNNQEGLIGVGVSTLQYEENGIKYTKVYTVLNGFDPNKNWENGSNIISVDINNSK